MVCIENRYFPLLIFLTPNPVSIYLLLKISTSSFDVLDYSDHKKWFQCLSLSISKHQLLREDKKGAEGLGKVVWCKLYSF